MREVCRMREKRMIKGALYHVLVFFIGIIACEVGKLVSKETKIDIIVTPAVTIITGGALAIVFAPMFKSVCDAL